MQIKKQERETSWLAQNYRDGWKQGAKAPHRDLGVEETFSQAAGRTDRQTGISFPGCWKDGQLDRELQGPEVAHCAPAPVPSHVPMSQQQGTPGRFLGQVRRRRVPTSMGITSSIKSRSTSTIWALLPVPPPQTPLFKLLFK